MLNKIDYRENLGFFEEIIISNLEDIGYIIIKNFKVDKSINNLRTDFLELNEKIGNLIGHDSNNKIIWDIKFNLQNKNNFKTFSGTFKEAELHTDSQYSKKPEEFFSLLTLQKDTHNGGMSHLLTLEDILIDLRETQDGKYFEKILRETEFPFIVPDVFKKNKANKWEYSFGPILRDNEIRFRVDTFEKAIENDSNICSQEQIKAFYKLKNIILNCNKTKKFYLENRDIIFINNKTVLHGRSSFTDYERHLLRIRGNFKKV